MPSTWPAAQDPIHGVMARDVAANNVNHYGDVYGQCRANFSACPLVPNSGYIECSSDLTNQWHPMFSTGAFPVTTMHDGTPYRIRFHIAGSNGGASDVVRFAVVLSRVGASRNVLDSAGLDGWWQTGNITSSSAAYLSGTSQGTGAYARMVEMTAAERAACVVTSETIADVSGPSIGVSQTLVEVSVYAQHDKLSSRARLYAFSAWEVAP